MGDSEDQITRACQNPDEAGADVILFSSEEVDTLDQTQKAQHHIIQQDYQEAEQPITEKKEAVQNDKDVLDVVTKLQTTAKASRRRRGDDGEDVEIKAAAVAGPAVTGATSPAREPGQCLQSPRSRLPTSATSRTKNRSKPTSCSSRRARLGTNRPQLRDSRRRRLRESAGQ
eukprot:5693772-Pyramimonas_sp.AAC.1